MNFESPEVIRERRLAAIEAEQSTAARERSDLRDHVRASERRILDRVHKTGAMTSAAAFAVGALITDGPRGYWCLAAMIACMAAADWPVPVRPVLASFRTHPWLWVITIAVGAAGGITAGLAVGHPSALRIAVAAAVLALGLVWIGLILRAGSRNRKAA